MWKDDMMQVIRPKGRGAGLMVSDFIEEKGGYLAIPDSMYEAVKQHDLHAAGILFDAGKNCDGCWNNKLFSYVADGNGSKGCQSKISSQCF